MPITVRAWTGSGTNKTNGATLFISTFTGTDYPQPGDVLVVGWVADNLTASTPNTSGAGYVIDNVSLVVGGPGTQPMQWVTDASASAAGDVVHGYGLVEVVAPFTASPSLTVQGLSGVTAKAACVFCITGVVGLAGVSRAVVQAPTAGTSGSIGAGPLAGEIVVVGNVSQSATPPALLSGTSAVTANTTGGSGATNAAIRLGYSLNPAVFAQASSIADGVFVLQLTPIDPAVTQAAYRFYADGTETGSTALAAQDTGYTADISGGDLALGLRTRLQSTSPTAQPATDDWLLKFEKNASGVWADVGIPNKLAATHPVSAGNSQTNLALTFPRRAVSFLGDGQRLTRAGFYINKANFPDGDLTASLYAHTGTFGVNGLPTGSPLTVSTTTVAAASLSVSVVMVYFDFDASFTLAAGTPYFIALTSTITVASPNGITMYADISASTYPGSTASWNGSAWSFQSYDLIFEVYSTVADTLVDSYDDGVAPSGLTGLTVAGTVLAQSFMGNGSRLSRAAGYIQKVGVPPGNVSAVLYAHSGTFGTTSRGTGPPLATSTARAATGFQTSYAWEEFVFDGTFTLTNGVPYVIGFVTDTATDSSNAAQLGADTTSPTHAGNSTTLSASIWSEDASRDYKFRVYGPGGKVVTGNALATPTDGSATTNRLTAGTGTFVAGEVSNDGLVDNLGWSGNNYTELLYSILLKQADLSNSDVLRFRVLRNGATTGLTYTQTPTLTASLGAPPQTKTPADTAAGSDSAVPVQDFQRSPADTAGGLDAATFTFILPPQNYVQNPSDTAAGSDSVTSPQTLLRTGADTADGADSAVPVQTFLRVPADLAAGADSAVPVQTFLRVPADPAAGADAATFTFFTPTNDVTATPTDIAGGLDAATSVYDRTSAPADTAAGSDSETNLATVDRTVTDPAAGSDDANAMFSTGAINRVENPADIAPGIDAVTTISDDLRVPGDTAAGSDLVTIGPDARVRVPADTAAGADLATTAQTRATGPADTAAGSDAATALFDHAVLLGDVAGGLDAASTVREVTLADTATASDLATLLATYDRTAADLAAGSDAASTQQSASGAASPADVAAGSDTVTALATRDRTAADTAAGSDSALFERGVGATLADTAAGSDTATPTATRDRTAQDAAAGADAVTDDLVMPRTGTDTAAGSDALSAIFDRVLNPADPAAGADSVTRVRDLVAADVATGLDTLSLLAVMIRTAADTADGADNVTTQKAGTGTASAADPASGDDTATALLARLRTPADTAAGADTVSAERGSNPADTAAGSDTVTVVAARIRDLADTAPGTDTASTAGAGVASRSDLASGADALLLAWDRSALASDTATGTDALAVGRDMVVTISDSAQGVDNATRSRIAFLVFADNATGSDLATATIPPKNPGVPVYGVDVVVRPYAGSVLVDQDTPIRAVVEPTGDRVLVKVGTDG